MQQSEQATFEELCAGGALTGSVARSLRESAQRISAADEEHRAATAKLLVLHARVMNRGVGSPPASRDELAAIRAAELQAVAAAERRLAIAESALLICRNVQQQATAVGA
jgi:hypothetical protein